MHFLRCVSLHIDYRLKCANHAFFLADVLNTEIVTIHSEEGAAFGAALLAATGTGVFGSVEEACSSTIMEKNHVTPGSSSSTYDQIYREYRQLYPALKDSFHRITEIIS